MFYTSNNLKSLRYRQLFEIIRIIEQFCPNYSLFEQLKLSNNWNSYSGQVWQYSLAHFKRITLSYCFYITWVIVLERQKRETEKSSIKFLSKLSIMPLTAKQLIQDSKVERSRALIKIWIPNIYKQTNKSLKFFRFPKGMLFSGDKSTFLLHLILNQVPINHFSFCSRELKFLSMLASIFTLPRYNLQILDLMFSWRN